MAKTGLLQTIRHGAMVLGVCASLAVGVLGLVGSAEARVPEGDRVSWTAQYCGSVQDSFDEAKRKGDYDLMRFWLEIWHAEGCYGHYGMISVFRYHEGPNIVTGVDTVSPGTSTGGKRVTGGSAATGGVSGLSVR
jgi:hypothetical protein